MADPSLSEKRRRAGRRGAAARWGKQNDTKPPLRTARPVAKLRQGRNDWYRIENKAADTAEVFIYDEIGYFGVTAADFVEDLRDITADRIELHLNTPGGDVFDGIAIYNALRDHAADVAVTVDGIAASAGSFIAQAGDHIVMNRASQMMIHDAWGLTIGSADDMREMADKLDKHTMNIAAIYAERAGGTADTWREAMRDETWYSADEAVAAGLADEVKGGGSASKNSFDLSVFTYAGREKAPAPEPVTEPAPAPSVEVDIDFDEITQGLKEAFA